MRLWLFALLFALAAAPLHAQSGNVKAKAKKAESQVPKSNTDRTGGMPADTMPIDSSSMKVIGPGSAPAASPGSGRSNPGR
jgi:hypothetical protein